MYGVTLVTIAALASTSLAAPGWRDSPNFQGPPAGWKGGRPGSSCGAPAPSSSAPTSTRPPTPPPSGTPSIDVTFFSDGSCDKAVEGPVVVDIVGDQCRDAAGTFGSLLISRIDPALTGVANSGPNSTWGLHIGAESNVNDCDFQNSVFVDLNEKDLVNRCFSVAIATGQGKPTVGGKEYRIESFVPA